MTDGSGPPKAQIRELHTIVNEGARVAIMLKNDPGPGCAVERYSPALRALFGRNKLTTPIFAFARSRIRKTRK